MSKVSSRHLKLRSKRSPARAHFIFALGFLLLGTGNIIFGYYKSAPYQEILSGAARELASPEKSAEVPMLSTPINRDEQAQYIQRLKAHFDFYQFTILGGKCFLAIGGVFLLLSLTSLTESER